MGNLLSDVYKNRTVIVTGHTGFKGSWLSLWLKELGCDVVGYSLDPPTNPSLYDSINLKSVISNVKGDIRDANLVHSVFEEYQPEFVFHLAAQPLVRLSYKEPRLTYETNIMGTVNVLEAVRKTASIRACIIVTSDKCYENKEWFYSYRETDSMGGYDPYSSSKGCAELITTSYRQSFFNCYDCFGLPNVALSSVRAGNVIGGGDWANDRVIPDCVKAIINNEKVRIRNPFAIRPWQFVLEPLGGYLLLGALMFKYPSRYSGAWNFGPNNENVVTVKELVELVIKSWGKGDYIVDTSSSCFHEANILKLDITKAQMQLGWLPVYDINQTVARTVNWYKKFYAGLSKNELYALALDEIHEYTKRTSKARENLTYLTENINS
jgi:CDP-glucose 4,6-dehydratase